LEFAIFSNTPQKGRHHKPSLIRDKDDLKFLECALSGKANYLVSGDKDVLEVKKFQTIKVLNAKGFLEVLEKL